MIRAKDNPFATDRVERLLRFDPALAGTSWDALHARWEELGRRGAVVGRHGAGKTTFLDSWKKRLEARGQVVTCIFLNREHREPTESQWGMLESKSARACSRAAAAGSEVLFLDGAEQLTRRSRRRLDDLVREVPGFLEARHRPAKEPVLLALDPGPEVLADCLRRLSPRQAEVLQDELPLWWKECRGNLREIFLRCYDATARGH